MSKEVDTSGSDIDLEKLVVNAVEYSRSLDEAPGSEFDEVDLGKKLSENGIDSLGIAELQLYIEDALEDSK